MNDEKYDAELRKLQIQLVKSQIWAISQGQKAIIIFEGRDAAGKDGAIKRVTEHLSPRSTRVVALPKPSDRERDEWYFQRYVRYLPSAGEWVLFNRSWYNRAGVEAVMNFSTPAEQEQFLLDVPFFERMLVQSGAQIVKYWLDVSRDEQHKRLKERRTDPLKKLKTGPMDVEAERRFDDYTRARDDMLIRTHTPVAPWICVRADNKKAARLNIMRHLLHAIGSPDLSRKTPLPDNDILFPFDAEALNDGRLAR
ncbi:MAG: ppk2 [Caulobacteraceae bacterium]|jgi:polyphosphate kinase 2|nr:ppk2 [Caulobacteraceae bacterium]